jgi:hypothetical protein
LKKQNFSDIISVFVANDDELLNKYIKGYLRLKQTKIEEKTSNTLKDLIIDQLAENLESIRTYLSNDMATIYVKDIKRHNGICSVTNEQFDDVKPVMKNLLKIYYITTCWKFFR